MINLTFKVNINILACKLRFGELWDEDTESVIVNLKYFILFVECLIDNEKWGISLSFSS